jgi:hypothetical protein
MNQHTLVPYREGILGNPLLEGIEGWGKKAFNTLPSPLISPTFAIRTEKQSFSGINRLETLDFTGVNFQNGL